MTEAVEGCYSGEAEKKSGIAFPPYFKVPDTIFNVGLSSNEIAVYANLSKRAGGEGECWPSEPTIAKDVGIRSVKTVRNALRSLKARGFIILVSPPGQIKKSATYRVRPFAVEAAAKRALRDSEEKEAATIIPDGAPENVTSVKFTRVNKVGSKTAKMTGDRAKFTDEGGRICPEGRYEILVRGVRNTYKGIPKKEDSVKEDTEKEKESPPFCGAPPPQGDSTLVLSGESTLSPSPAIGGFSSNQESLLIKTNRYYHALSLPDKETFDREARRIHRSKSMPSLVELRELRSKFFGLTQFAQQTYFPSAEALRIATVVLDESRAERMRELESAHT